MKWEHVLSYLLYFNIKFAYMSPSVQHVQLRFCLVCVGIGVNTEGKKIFLRDIWPTREEIQAVEKQFVIPAMFKEVYEKVEVSKLGLSSD